MKQTYRIMVPDASFNVLADSEAEAEKLAASHIAANPPGTEGSVLHFITWPDDREEADIW